MRHACIFRRHGVGMLILLWDDDAGQPGEQFTMFFQDTSGNSLEFKVRHQRWEDSDAKYSVCN